MEEALKKKDEELAEAQRAAQEKTRLAEEKLASVGALEEEITRLKSALDSSTKQQSKLKKDKEELHNKAGELAGKSLDLEIYLGELAKKLYLVLEGNLHASDWLAVYD